MPPAVAVVPAFLRVKECARRYSVSEKFIYEHIERGTGPKVYRVGKVMIRIRPEDFEEWMVENPGRTK